MSNTAIKATKLGKKYIIDHQSTGRYSTFRDLVISKIRTLGSRLQPGRGPSGSQDKREEFWALRDVTFEVRQGERIGVIGRNGAGKSTLLKILSRITEPSSGRVELRGRVASLLEVGTGFHQELTGRENIFLNGAILGMGHSEIRKKFDEIVAFAEVEKFLDTPVKRYSSGMYVRLAFAIAAHVEPEVLIVDEVLAVGDAQFQKKCLGRMEAAAAEGRTVLFVSHNMSAIKNLCTRGILLADGKVVADTGTNEAIDEYMRLIQESAQVNLSERDDRRGNGAVRFTAMELLNREYRVINQVQSGETLIVRLHYRAEPPRKHSNARLSISVHGYGNVYFLASSELVLKDPLVLDEEGYIDCVIDDLPLSKGEYHLNIFMESNLVVQDWIEAAGTLSVLDGDFYGTGRSYPPGWEGKTVLVKQRWEVA